MFSWLREIFFGTSPSNQPPRARTAAEVVRPNRTRAEAWAAIETTDLTRVAQALVTREGWERNRADEAVISYRQFLYLILRYPGRTLVPWTLDLDAAWHAHLLDSRRYADDTIRLFGGFLHHNPDLPQGSPEQRAGLGVTRTLHETEFGPFNERNVRPVDDRRQGRQEERARANHDTGHAYASTGCSSSPVIACSTASSSPSHSGSHDSSPGHSGGDHGSHDAGASCGASDGGGASCGGASCGGGGCGGGGD